MKDLISVIVLVDENVEPSINVCLDSIVNQTYKNIDIVIIASNATANTIKLCNYYKKKDKRISLFLEEKKNKKNIGILKSRGKYITFVNGKDYLDKNYILQVYNLIVDEDADIVSTLLFKKKDNLKYSTYKKPEIMRGYLNLDDSSCYGKIYKKDLFENIKFKEGVNEDLKTTYKLFDKSKSVVISNIQKYHALNHTEVKKDTEYMERIYILSDILTSIEKEYPSLISEAKKKICLEAFYMFPYIKLKSFRKQLYEYIKIYRKYVINDENVSLQNKMLSISSLFGFSIMNLFLKVETILKKT